MGHDTLLSSEWGTPNMIEHGLVPELLLAGKDGHRIHVWNLRTRKHERVLDGTWWVLAGLGAFHGLNLGMGWHFAVALALQRHARSQIWRALPPIALGHALSIGVFSLIMLVASAALPEAPLRLGAAAAVAIFALFRIWRKKHLTWVGMQVGFRDLTLWSFLMATAHGAGLMLAPVLLGRGLLCAPGGDVGWAGLLDGRLLATSLSAAVGAVMVHTVADLTVSAVMAVLVYELLGVRVLRHAWFNIDRLWSGALLLAAVTVSVP